MSGSVSQLSLYNFILWIGTNLPFLLYGGVRGFRLYHIVCKTFRKLGNRISFRPQIGCSMDGWKIDRATGPSCKMSLFPIFHLTTRTDPTSENMCIFLNTCWENFKNLVDLHVYCTHKRFEFCSAQNIYICYDTVIWSVFLSNVRLYGVIIRSTSMLIYISSRNYVNVNNLTFIIISVSRQFLESNKRLNLWYATDI
jgi:hypothetical protein